MNINMGAKNKVNNTQTIGKSVGLWIDHEKAVIVVVNGSGEEIIPIISNVEKRPDRTGAMRAAAPYETIETPADDILQRRFTEHLRGYYNSVIARIRDANFILIFGPGEAKAELKKLMEKDNLGRQIVGVGTADKMTDCQVAAKVRKYFGEKNVL